MMSELRTYGLRQKGRLVRVMLLWVFATGCLIRRGQWMRADTGSTEQPHSHRCWFLWETLTFLTWSNLAKGVKDKKKRFLIHIKHKIKTTDDLFSKTNSETKPVTTWEGGPW